MAVAARNTARPVRTHPAPGMVTVHERLPPTIQSITPPSEFPLLVHAITWVLTSRLPGRAPLQGRCARCG